MYPGSNVYWVSHDNVLASYALEEWNTTIADNITATIRRIVQEYGLTVTESGLPLDCKMEALLGYNVDLLFNATEEVILNASYYGSILKTERTTNSVFSDFQNYSDLLCYASLVEWRRLNDSGADYYFEEVKALWDGKGFKDMAFSPTQGYETYKLGLFYLLSRKLHTDFEFKKDLIETVWSCQNDNGGFKTHYFSKGNPNPDSKTNTETTSIILLANVPLSS